MRFLFVKTELCFPRSSGHDVHSYEMMRALIAQGHEVALLTAAPQAPQAIEGLDLFWSDDFANVNEADQSTLTLTKLQAKFCSYWGVSLQRVAQTAAMAEKLNVDAVVPVGLEVLPYLAGVKGRQRVWYAADEWALHHWTLFFLRRPSTWANLKTAAIKGLYERAFARCTDSVWVVSKADGKWVRRVMGRRPKVAIIPNGVDAEHFNPAHFPGIEEKPKSCVFWGRLDFEPNIDAIDYFTRNVWPTVKAKHPDATLSVYGFKPGDEVRAMHKAHGFNLVADAPDIREAILQHQVVVLPFVSGAGIKNKMLEAACLQRPILVTRKALNGIDLPDMPATPDTDGQGGGKPLLAMANPKQWADTLDQLWQDDAQRNALGDAARQWVLEAYTWPAAAKHAVEHLQNDVAPPTGGFTQGKSREGIATDAASSRDDVTDRAKETGGNAEVAA